MTFSKVCYRCDIEQPLSAFSNEKKKSDGKSSRCRTCSSEMFKNWRNANLETQRIKDRVTHYTRTYNLTLEDAKKLVDSRIGLCPICTQIAPLVVDHCHTSGAVRGLICSSCNSVLGYSKDSIKTLENSIKYLKDHYGET